MKLAILGGTFNPVHTGHLALADDVHVTLGYDRVLLVPANIPPHKELSLGAGTDDRLAMLRLAVCGSDCLGVEDCEIERGGLSYTIDTIECLMRTYGETIEGKIGLVIGQDLVEGFHTWHRAAELAVMVDLIIARRPGDNCSEGTSRAGFLYAFTSLENPLLTISSSDVRTAVQGGKSWRYLVPEPVYRYIVEHHLYEK